MQSLITPFRFMTSSSLANPSKPFERLSRVGLVLGICAALGAGVLAGPHPTTSQHAAISSVHMVASGSITGGPGNG